MKIFKFCSIILLTCLYFEPALADIIVFKSGRLLESDQVWREAGQVKYIRHGATVGIPEAMVREVIRVENDDEDGSTNTTAFGFDIWPLGIEIEEAMDIAERNDIPLHRAGLISGNKGFHPSISRKYMATHSRFNYKTDLLGYPSTVTLVFTPKSKWLARIEISLNRRLKRKDDSPFDDIIKLLSDKYGKPSRSLKNFVLQKNYHWVVYENGLITLEKFFGSAKLLYANRELDKRLEAEKKQKQTNMDQGYISRDANKF